MKKVLSLAAFGLVLASVAAPQKLAVVSLNDRVAILNQASKLGELTGVPMIGLGAVGALAANPLAADFGAPRDGAVTTISLYGDPDVLKSVADAEKFAETLHYAVAYPGATDKTTNETWKVVSSLEGISGIDGKWAVVGDDAETVKLAVADLAKTGTPVLKQGEVARASLTEPAIAVMIGLMDALAAEDPEMAAQMKVATACYKQVEGVSFALRVTEKGIDLLCDLGCKPGSELDKMGTSRLTSSDPLAFAGKESLAACATAAGCGTQDGLAQYEKALEIFKKRGLKLDFLSCTTKGRVMDVVLDVKALADLIVNGEADRWVTALEDESLQKDLEDLMEKTYASSAVAAGPEQAITFSIKGQTLSTTPSVRLAKALPEFKGKPVYSVGVVSIYSLLRKVVEASLQALPPSAGASQEQLEMVRNLLQTLPAEGEGCTAMACWREGSSHSFIMRLTPDEVKGLSAVVKLGMTALEGALSMQGADGGAFGEELPDDDED